MRQFHRCLLGEYKKRKRSVFVWLHLGIPLIFPAALVMYFLSRNDLISTEAGYAVFLELIAVGTPLMIALICGRAADAESDAGNFQHMLGTLPSKSIAFVSQTVMMISSYGAAIFLTAAIYTVALKFVVGVEGVRFTPYLLIGIIFTITSVFQYFLYQVIAYKYGIGVCSICGFAGVVVVALSLTTLGDKVWGFLPWAWASRFSKYSLGYLKINDGHLVGDPMLVTGSYAFLILTTGVILFGILWIRHWTGRKTIE